MDFYFSVVTDESQLAKFVHEKADTRSGRPDHICQRFLIDIRIDRLRATLFAKICQEKK
jgi:hypothetical protein